MNSASQQVVFMNKKKGLSLRLPAYPCVLVILLLLIVVGIFASLGVGGHSMSVEQIIDAIRLRWQSDSWSQTPEATIIWRLRLPRTLLALLVGINLSLSGVLLQGIMRNPLAAPDIVGVTAGAGLAATLIIVVAPTVAVVGSLGIFTLPVAAFCGALVVAATVFALSWQPGAGTSPIRMILAGVAVNAMVGGFQGFFMVYFSDRVQGIVLWLAGSLNTRSWYHVMLITPFTLLGVLISIALVRQLNLLQLGESIAHSLGVHVNRTRIFAIVAASLLTGAAVCTVGNIGFVGLVIPHIMRMTVGHQHGRLIPATMLAGAAMVLWADVAARLLGEMPVGVFTAMIGGPYFVVLLYGRKLI